jgi:hypothetical protein
MDLNEQSFQLIADFLNQTLSPDPNVRRPGKIISSQILFL